MVNAIRSTTASTVARDGTQAINNNALQTPQITATGSVVGNSSSSSATNGLPEVGPAYEVEISAEGKAMAESRGGEAASTAGTDTKQSMESISDQAKKQQQDWRIQSAAMRMKQTEQNIRAHEAAHMAAGGGFAGSASYIYAKGPDGKMYVVGGEVPIQAPEGKTPEETVKNMEVVQRAALAPPDPSAQDLAVAAAAMQIESRARAAIRQGRFLTQADMQEEDQPGALSRPPVWPTSMAGLIATLMPADGMHNRSSSTPSN